MGWGLLLGVLTYLSISYHESESIPTNTHEWGGLSLGLLADLIMKMNPFPWNRLERGGLSLRVLMYSSIS